MIKESIMIPILIFIIGIGAGLGAVHGSRNENKPPEKEWSKYVVKVSYINGDVDTLETTALSVSDPKLRSGVASGFFSSSEKYSEVWMGFQKVLATEVRSFQLLEKVKIEKN